MDRITFNRDASGQIERRIHGDGIDVIVTAGTWERIRRARERARSTGVPQRLVFKGGRPFELRISTTHIGVSNLTTGARTVVSIGALA